MTPLVIDALAAYRLTRLVTTDTLTQPLRARLQRRSKWLGQLVHCPHCTGIWIGFGVVAARQLAPKLWQPVGTALAVAAVTSLLEDTV